MRNIKITYAYDGSDFYGFQRQPDKRTVQGEIERVLKIILKEDNLAYHSHKYYLLRPEPMGLSK